MFEGQRFAILAMFTLGGQEGALANIDSLSPTMVEARAKKNARYISEENGTEWKWKEKFNNITLVCDDSLTIQPHKVIL